MAKKQSLKLTEGEVSQTFDLKAIFGVDFSNKGDLRQAIGQAIIDRIVERTQKGFAHGGNSKLKSPYSRSYANSLPFKAFGKSRNQVNMELTGSMLGTLDIVEETDNTIKIGWDDETQNAKAFNHHTGDTVPARPFFGLSLGEIEGIRKKFLSEVSRDEPISRQGHATLDAIAVMRSSRARVRLSEMEGSEE